MTDREALYQSVLAHPDADLPRLVFADYLEENGEEPLAAFIRMQCEMARVPKWDPIWIHGCWVDRSWVTGHDHIERIQTLPGASIRDYRRGFPWLFAIDLSEFVASGGPVFDQHPVGALLIDGRGRPTLAGLASASWLSRITRLAFWRGRLDDRAIRPLLESEHGARLNELHFRFEAIVESGLAALLRSPLARQLRELRLDGNFFLDHGRPLVAAFDTGTSMPALERLDLQSDRLTGTAVVRVLESLDAPKLNRLELVRCHLGADGCTALARCCKFSTVESLNLAMTEPAAAGIKAISVSPHFGNLKILKLQSNRVGPVAVKAMVAASWFANLHVLDLGNANISDNGAKAIAESPASANLRVLDLTRNAITDPGAKALLDSPHLTSLLHLDLDQNEIGPKLLAALRKRFGGQIGWERVVWPKKKR